MESQLKIGIAGECFKYGFEKGFKQDIKTIESIEEIKDFDLIVFSGGEDVTPELYGEVNTNSYNNPKRDAFEYNILQECLKLDKKIFGVCRGHQLINAVLGGKLNQNLIPSHRGSHLIKVIKDNPIVDYYKDKLVTSMHHQAVLQPGKDFEVLALHPELFTIEATKCNDNIITVQFHPEVQSYPEFFNLVKEWC